MPQLRDAAIRLAEHGYRVFPLAPNGRVPAFEKHPDRVATSDPEAVRRLWTDKVTGWEQPYNIGVALPDDVLVVDVDIKNGKEGKRNLQLIESIYDPLPATYRVRTPSRGDHHYYRVPRDAGPFAAQLTVDVDLKGRNPFGWVIGEGSVIDGVAYTASSGQPDILADLPDAYLPLVKGKTRPTVTGEAVVEADTDDALRRAAEWLETAEPAIEGDAGDHRTFAVAARVMDFGVSAEAALDLLLEHWNDRCSPPWSPDELERKVQNAARYRHLPIGAAAPDADFEPETLDLLEPHKKAATSPDLLEVGKSLFEPLEPFDPATLPRRQWVIPRFAARRFVTGLVSPPGVGKTTFLLTLALAAATGRDLLGHGMAPAAPVNVLLWNQEDDADELRRRLAAIMAAFDVAWADIGERLYLQSGVDTGALFAKGDANGTATATRFAKRVGAFLQARDVRLAIFDPLAELHNLADENANAPIRAVAAVFRDRMAVAADCAVVMAHHTRKPPAAGAGSYAGDMDSARGGGSLAGVFRLGATLYGLDDKTARDYGIGDADRHRFVRLDDAKSNLSLVSGEPSLYRREGVSIGGIDGEEIGVLRPAGLQRRSATTPEEMRRQLVDQVDAALGERDAAPLRDIVGELVEAGLADGRSPETLRKAVRLALASPVERDGGTVLKCETARLDGKPGRPLVVLREAAGYT